MKKNNLILCLILLLVQLPAFAYIGPGAGIPFIGSFIGFVVTVILIIMAILFWPIRKLLKNKRNKKNSNSDNK